MGGKGRGGRAKGGAKGKKRKAARKQWDDAYGEERATLGVSVNDIADAATAAPAGKRARTAERRESMMAQWKKRKQAQRNKHKTFASKAEEKKHLQRQQYEQQRRRAADAVYGKRPAAADREALPDAAREDADSDSEEEESDDDDDDDGSEEGDERRRRGKRRSVFDQFVQAFQPAAPASDAELEEEDDEEDAEYEEIEVDEDGNPVEDAEADDGEPMEDSDAADEDEQEQEEEEEEQEEEEEDAGADEDTEASADVDPYRRRFLLGEFSETDAKRFDSAPRKFVSLSREQEAALSPVLDEFNVSYKPGAHTNAALSWLPTELNIRSRLKDAWSAKGIVHLETWQRDAPLEHALFTQMSSYADILFAGQTYELTTPLRRLTAMHVVNHVLKARDTVTRNNERLRKRQHKSDGGGESATSAEDEDETEYRDQGFSRPTVLVLMPLRSSAYAFVQELLKLLPSTVSMFHNKDRFEDEYRGDDDADLEEEDDEEEDDAQHGDRGDGDDHGDSIEKTSTGKNRKQRRRRPTVDKEEMKEWQRVFSEGNNDDSFQIGISFTRRSIKFYSDYRQADIILASPLGLRQQLGDELVDVAEKQVITADFLSSIEVCVLDSASLLMMQNIEHVRLLLQAINVKPKEAPNADFSRLREWNLAFLGAYFRQTIVFAHGVEPALLNLVNKLCKNQSGVIKYVRNYDSNIDASAASITQVVPKVKQIFQRIDLGRTALSARDEVELRFEYFQKHIFEPLLDQPRRHVLIFIPSYFDYVRIRNLFHDTMNQKIIRAVQCCEYTESRQVTRARTTFFHGRCHVMLFTERFHFYHQYRIRGIHQLIWYGLPQMGEFYPELLNMFEDKADDDIQEQSQSSVALFTRLDMLRLQRVVGQKRAERMCQPTAKKSTFLFC
ncbi:hypothetical protein P43SY_004349 [Pythium insidiosum]|uniref:Digestive organ expansion factor n=1 Tax=Pythium insidiosum TaxID=114742 RepID=A0AAD5M9A1_PYTIN|nr:hypothetical protein P43SY_004349 [Pythium insidiosum]